MNLSDIRKQYPQYDKVTDEDLAKALHKKFYSHVDFNTFAGKIGYSANQGVKVPPPDSQAQQALESQYGVIRQPDKSGILQEAGRGLKRGFYGAQETLGTALDVLGADNLGQGIADESRKQHSINRMDPDISGNVIQDPSLLASPRWLAGAVAEAVPSLATAALPGGVAGNLAKAAGKSAKFAKYAGIITAGAAGGSMEGAGTYRTALDKGDSEGVALAKGATMAAGSAALNSLSFGKMLSGKTKNKLLHAVTAGLTEGATEQAEEPLDAFLNNEDPVEAWLNGFNVFFPSMILGAAGGAGGKYVLDENEKAELETALDAALKDKTIKGGERVVAQNLLNTLHNIGQQKWDAAERDAAVMDDAPHAEARGDISGQQLKEKMTGLEQLSRQIFGDDQQAALPKPDTIYAEAESGQVTTPEQLAARKQYQEQAQQAPAALPKPEVIYLGPLDNPAQEQKGPKPTNQPPVDTERENIDRQISEADHANVTEGLTNKPGLSKSSLAPSVGTAKTSDVEDISDVSTTSNEFKQFMSDYGMTLDGAREVVKAQRSGESITLQEAQDRGDAAEARRESERREYFSAEATKQRDVEHQEAMEAQKKERRETFTRLGGDTIEDGFYEDQGTGLVYEIRTDPKTGRRLVLAGIYGDMWPKGMVTTTDADVDVFAFAYLVKQGEVIKVSGPLKPQSKIDETARKQNVEFVQDESINDQLSKPASQQPREQINELTPEAESIKKDPPDVSENMSGDMSHKEPWEMTEKDFHEEYTFHGSPYKLDELGPGTFFSDFQYATGYAKKPGAGPGSGNIYAVRKSEIEPIDAAAEDIFGQSEIDNKASLRSGKSHAAFHVRSFSPHKAIVEQALSEGKPVPAEVLADYPDLQQKLTKEPAKVDNQVAKPDTEKTTPQTVPQSKETPSSRQSAQQAPSAQPAATGKQNSQSEPKAATSDTTSAKKPSGWVWIKEQQLPFTSWREIVKGKNAGKVAVNVRGREVIVDKSKVEVWPETGSRTAPVAALQTAPRKDGDKYTAGFSWNSRDGKKTILGHAKGRPVGWLEIEKENSSSKQYIHIDDIAGEIDFDTKQLEQDEKFDAEIKQQQAEEAKERAEYEDVDGFTDGLGDMQKGRVLKTLNKQVRADGKATTIKALIRNMVAEGRIIGEYAGRRTLETLDGNFRDEKDLTKTGIDYAEFLISKRDATPEKLTKEPAKVDKTDQPAQGVRAETDGAALDGGPTTKKTGTNGGIDHSRIKRGDMIKFKLGDRVWSEMVLQVFGDNHGPISNTYQVDVFGDKFIKHEDVEAVKHKNGDIQKATTEATNQPAQGVRAETGEDSAAADDISGYTYAMGDDDARFRSVMSGEGMNADEIFAALEPLYQSWKSIPEIEVVQDVTDLPNGLQVQFSKAKGMVTGAFWQGKVYLVAGNIKSAEEARKTLLHETIGHWGLRRVFGREKTSRFLKQVYLGLSRDQLKDIVRWYDLDLSVEEDRLIAAEEYLAHLAETGQTPSVWQKFVAWFKEQAARIGIRFELTEDDIRAILQRGVMSTGRTSGALADSPVRLRSSAWHGSPHMFDKFSTSAIGTGEGAQAYGYGLYFAGSREIAEWYKDKLSGNQWTTAEGELTGFDLVERMVRSMERNGHITQHSSMRQIANNVLDGLEKAKSLKKYLKAYELPTGQYAEFYSDAVEALRALDPKPSKGRLYKVELAPEEDEYLLWDRPLSEQSALIDKALDNLETMLSAALSSGKKEILPDGETVASKLQSIKDVFRKSAAGDVNADDLYRMLSGKLTQKSASEYLHALGVRGIKYLDGDSRASGKGNYNYVIFHADDVSIEARFRARPAAGEPYIDFHSTVPEVDKRMLYSGLAFLDKPTKLAAEKVADSVESFMDKSKIPFRKYNRRDTPASGASDKDNRSIKTVMDDLGIRGERRKAMIKNVFGEDVGEDVTLTKLKKDQRTLLKSFLDNVTTDPYGKAVIAEIAETNGTMLDPDFVAMLEYMQDLPAGTMDTIDTGRAADIVDRSGTLYKQTIVPYQDAYHNIRTEMKESQSSLRSLMPGVAPGSKLSATLQDFAEGIIGIEDVPVKWRTQVKAAAAYTRSVYDKNLIRLNEARALAGKKPIVRRDDYFTHGMEIGLMTKFFGGINRIPNEALMTTRSTHPNSPYFRYEKRMGGNYVSDGIGNFMAWQQNALNVIHYTPVMVSARAHIKHLPPNAYRYFTQWADEVLAGKKNEYDRIIARAVPEWVTKGASWMRNRAVKNIISASARMVVQQPSSFVTSFTQLATGPARNIKDVAMNVSDAFAGYQTAFTEWGRMFSDAYSREYRDRAFIDDFDPGMINNLEYKLQFFNRTLDRYMVSGAFLGAYRQLTRQGMLHEEAVIEADKIAARTQASYTKGMLPPALRSENVKNFMPLQTFTFNFMNYVRFDTAGMTKDRGKAAAIARGLTLMAACAAMNQLYEWMRLRPCWDWSSLIPGLGYVKYGASSAPLVLAHSLVSFFSGETKEAKRDIKKLAWQIIPPFGGEQVRKSIDGMMVSAGITDKPYSIDNPYDAVMACLFGPGSSPNAIEYWDKRDKGLIDILVGEHKSSSNRRPIKRKPIKRKTIKRKRIER